VLRQLTQFSNLRPSCVYGKEDKGECIGPKELSNSQTVVLITKFHCNPELRLQLHYRLALKIETRNEKRKKNSARYRSLWMENCFCLGLHIYSAGEE
jgi:hypothetical protein